MLLLYLPFSPRRKFATWVGPPKRIASKRFTAAAAWATRGPVGTEPVERC